VGPTATGTAKIENPCGLSRTSRAMCLLQLRERANGAQRGSLRQPDLVESQRYGELTGQLGRSRVKIMELPDGYEYWFRSEAVTLADLAEWIFLGRSHNPLWEFEVTFPRIGKDVCWGLRVRATASEAKQTILAVFGL